MMYGMNCVLSLMKSMKLNVCGIKVVKHGNMSINIVEVAKHYVHDMQEKIVWDL